jgi:taurine dioxygenase
MRWRFPQTAAGNLFCGHVRGHEALPQALKAAIEGKSTVHDASRNSAGLLRKGYAEVSDGCCM